LLQIDEHDVEAARFEVSSLACGNIEPLDTERDTPEVLRSYLASFEPHMVGLTGSPEEIAAVAKEFRVHYKKVPTKDGDYTMDHSAVVYMMGADGNFADALGYQEPEDRAVAKVAKLLQRS
jgi:protein SCO1